MSYQEQRSVVTMVSGVAILATFLSLALPRYQALDPAVMTDGVAQLHWGAGAMLIFIGASIVGRIIILILFSILYTMITGEEPPAIEDERDRSIELRTTHISQTIFILGFVAALLAVRAGSGPVGMLLWITVGGQLSELVGESVRIVFYRRGF